jgi:hypothetical protein
MLRRMWDEAGRAGQPEIVSIGTKPDPEKIAHLESIGVTEVAFGLPDKEPDEVRAYLDRLVGRLAR